jgi:NAD(P)-dependent dehydrogenase (short-subunit alcohol dehydrogenase family)
MLEQATRYNQVSLKGQTAYVTGGDSDIGSAICDAFTQCGANVAIAARNESKMQEVERALKANGTKVMTSYADVTNEKSVQDSVSDVFSNFHAIDILVNAAGVTGPVETPLHLISESDWDYVIGANIKGTFLGCKAVVPIMVKQNHGKIDKIAGTSGLRGYVNRAAYSSSKWAVRGMTRTLALEVGKYNINVNAICPGVVEGKRMSSIIEKKAKAWNCSEQEVYKKYVDEMALRRFTLAEDIARAAVYLVSDGGRQITGHDIVVDGGWDV